jgi:hypothetical protein
MTETAYQLTPATINLEIQQGDTYLRLWQIRFQEDLSPFPFFSSEGVLLWKGRSMFRTSYDAVSPVISLTSEALEVLILFDDSVTPNVVRYGLSLTEAQTAALPATSETVDKLVYDIEFERLSDGWVIKPQKGKIRVRPEATKP